MPAAYDTYDYPKYWENRQYEHESELIAIDSFLEKIPKIKKIIEIGAGYGRLVPAYRHRADKIIISDPSSKLLKIARKKYTENNVEFIQSDVRSLKNKFRRKSVDLVVMIRVLHHIDNIDKSLSSINHLLTDNGFLILEFANKVHLKAIISEIFKGNLTYLVDIFPKEKSKRSRSKKLPFKNYHPEYIMQKLKNHNFNVVQVRSVSNIRSVSLKRLIPLEFLLSIERHSQLFLSRIFFGPSIFILAKKRD